jgi:hypothetical protein
MGHTQNAEALSFARGDCCPASERSADIASQATSFIGGSSLWTLWTTRQMVRTEAEISASVGGSSADSGGDQTSGM